MIPHDLPPWHTVYQQTRRWMDAGCFITTVDDLRKLLAGKPTEKTCVRGPKPSPPPERPSGGLLDRRECRQAGASAQAEHEPMDAVPGQLEGREAFGQQRNWVSFDPEQGAFVCRLLNRAFDAFTAQIVESRVVRVLMEEDGLVLCASSDRLASDTGRPGKPCETCSDRDERCFLHWWIAWLDLESGLLFCHTLSRTGTMNFQLYANQLLQEQLLPSQVVTRIRVEEARRRSTGKTYRRVQFERFDLPFSQESSQELPQEETGD
jgi:hypothetical protein